MGLIERTEQVVRSGRCTDERLKCELAAPLAIEVVNAIEQKLGPLPDDLRRIYTRVSNGGVGPGYGLIGLRGGVKDDEERDVEQTLQWIREWTKEGDLVWPSNLVPILHFGCGIYACIDMRNGQIVDFDPNAWDETDSTWNQCFSTLAPSFRDWWERWLVKHGA